MRTTIWRTCGAAALLTACSGAGDARRDSAAARDSAAPAAAPAVGAESDPTHAASGGSGVPAGYEGRPDGGALTDARYTPRAGGGTWEVQTGPAHIVWAPGDTASGRYTARTKVAQLEKPSHPEGYGVFVGGKDLMGPGQRYTYFIVRGTGEYLIKVRDGGGTRQIVGWTAAPALAKQDDAGKASYELAVRVDADSVRFLAGETTVHAVAAGAVPTDGIAGLRINHNLHVDVQPVGIQR